MTVVIASGFLTLVWERLGMLPFTKGLCLCYLTMGPLLRSNATRSKLCLHWKRHLDPWHQHLHLHHTTQKMPTRTMTREMERQQLCCWHRRNSLFACPAATILVHPSQLLHQPTTDRPHPIQSSRWHRWWCTTICQLSPPVPNTLNAFQPHMSHRNNRHITHLWSLWGTPWGIHTNPVNARSVHNPRRIQCAQCKWVACCNGHRDWEHALLERFQDSSASTWHQHHHPTMGLPPEVQEWCPH